MRALSGGRAAAHEPPQGSRGSSKQGRRVGREDGGGGAANKAANKAAGKAAGKAASKTASKAASKQARDLPFLPDESSWLQDPNNVRGLRSVSVRMCHLLRQKQTCTCNEVADQLTEESQAAAMREHAEAKPDANSPVPEKNLRRRIYDALNVLASAGVVEKDGEVVHWRGLPDHIEVSALQSEKRQLQISIANKKRLAAQIQETRAAFEVLLKRNRDPEFSQETEQSARLTMPFVSIVADSRIQIDHVEMTPHCSAAEETAMDVDESAASGASTTDPAESAADSTPQRGARRTTRAASVPQTEAGPAMPATTAPPGMLFEVAGKFCLQDDADILKQMFRTDALKRRRLDLGAEPEEGYAV